MHVARRSLIVKTTLMVILVAWLSSAVAQFEVIGTATGSVDGEQRTWYALGYEGEAGLDGTARLQEMPAGLATYVFIDLQVHAEDRYMVEGTLSITGTRYGGLEGCPCAFDESEVLYFSTSSMFEGVYKSLESEVVVESFEVIGDGVAAVRGTYTAVLGFVENVMSGGDPDPADVVQVSGEFVMDRLIYEAP